MKIVLRIGGSIIGAPPKAKLVKEYAHIISKLVLEGHSVGVVVGGGAVAREYIKAARSLKLSSSQQDLAAIDASRLNASIVSMELGIKGTVPTTISTMVKALSKKKVAVMGGLKPGITTDAVATLLAQSWHANLMIKGSDQEGIYTADPRKDKSAKKLSRITHARMREILGVAYKPGVHSIVDPVAVKLLAKSKIKLIVLKGTNPKSVLMAVHGKKIGTLVSS